MSQWRRNFFKIREQKALTQEHRAVGAGRLVVTTDLARLQVTDWLLSHAIGKEYSDRADKLSKIVEAPKVALAAAKAQKGQETAQRPPSPAVEAPGEIKPSIILDADSPEFVQALHKVVASPGRVAVHSEFPFCVVLSVKRNIALSRASHIVSFLPPLDVLFAL